MTSYRAKSSCTIVQYQQGMQWIGVLIIQTSRLWNTTTPWCGYKKGKQGRAFSSSSSSRLCCYCSCIRYQMCWGIIWGCCKGGASCYSQWCHVPLCCCTKCIWSPLLLKICFIGRHDPTNLQKNGACSLLGLLMFLVGKNFMCLAY